MGFLKVMRFLLLFGCFVATHSHVIKRRELEQLDKLPENLRTSQKYIIRPVQTVTMKTDDVEMPPYDAVDFDNEDNYNEIEGKVENSQRGVDLRLANLAGNNKRMEEMTANRGKIPKVLQQSEGDVSELQQNENQAVKEDVSDNIDAETTKTSDEIEDFKDNVKEQEGIKKQQKKTTAKSEKNEMKTNPEVQKSDKNLALSNNVASNDMEIEVESPQLKRIAGNGDETKILKPEVTNNTLLKTGIAQDLEGEQDLVEPILLKDDSEEMDIKFRETDIKTTTIDNENEDIESRNTTTNFPNKLIANFVNTAVKSDDLRSKVKEADVQHSDVPEERVKSSKQEATTVGVNETKATKSENPNKLLRAGIRQNIEYDLIESLLPKDKSEVHEVKPQQSDTKMTIINDNNKEKTNTENASKNVEYTLSTNIGKTLDESNDLGGGEKEQKAKPTKVNEVEIKLTEIESTTKYDNEMKDTKSKDGFREGTSQTLRQDLNELLLLKGSGETTDDKTPKIAGTTTDFDANIEEPTNEDVGTNPEYIIPSNLGKTFVKSDDLKEFDHEADIKQFQFPQREVDETIVEEGENKESIGKQNKIRQAVVDVTVFKESDHMEAVAKQPEVMKPKVQEAQMKIAEGYEFTPNLDKNLFKADDLDNDRQVKIEFTEADAKELEYKNLNTERAKFKETKAKEKEIKEFDTNAFEVLTPDSKEEEAKAAKYKENAKEAEDNKMEAEENKIKEFAIEAQQSEDGEREAEAAKVKEVFDKQTEFKITKYQMLKETETENFDEISGLQLSQHCGKTIAKTDDLANKIGGSVEGNTLEIESLTSKNEELQSVQLRNANDSSKTDILKDFQQSIPQTTKLEIPPKQMEIKTPETPTINTNKQQNAIEFRESGIEDIGKDKNKDLKQTLNKPMPDDNNLLNEAKELGGNTGEMDEPVRETQESAGNTAKVNFNYEEELSLTKFTQAKGKSAVNPSESEDNTSDDANRLTQSLIIDENIAHSVSIDHLDFPDNSKKKIYLDTEETDPEDSTNIDFGEEIPLETYSLDETEKENSLTTDKLTNSVSLDHGEEAEEISQVNEGDLSGHFADSILKVYEGKNLSDNTKTSDSPKTATEFPEKLPSTEDTAEISHGEEISQVNEGDLNGHFPDSILKISEGKILSDNTKTSDSPKTATEFPEKLPSTEDTAEVSHAALGKNGSTLSEDKVIPADKPIDKPQNIITTIEENADVPINAGRPTPKPLKWSTTSSSIEAVKETEIYEIPENSENINIYIEDETNKKTTTNSNNALSSTTFFQISPAGNGATTESPQIFAERDKITQVKLPSDLALSKRKSPLAAGINSPRPPAANSTKHKTSIRTTIRPKKSQTLGNTNSNKIASTSQSNPPKKVSTNNRPVKIELPTSNIETIIISNNKPIRVIYYNTSPKPNRGNQTTTTASPIRISNWRPLTRRPFGEISPFNRHRNGKPSNIQNIPLNDATNPKPNADKSSTATAPTTPKPGSWLFNFPFIRGQAPSLPDLFVNPFNTNSNSTISNQTQSTFGVGFLAMPWNWRPLNFNTFSYFSPNRIIETPPPRDDINRQQATTGRDLAFWNALFHKGFGNGTAGGLFKQFSPSKWNMTNMKPINFLKPWNITKLQTNSTPPQGAQNDDYAATIPANTQILHLYVPLKFPFQSQIVQTPAYLDGQQPMVAIYRPVKQQQQFELTKNRSPLKPELEDETGKISGDLKAKTEEKASLMLEMKLPKPVTQVVKALTTLGTA